MDNLYDILGVSKTATNDEIKKAYRKQALIWHPDRNPDGSADAKFKQISEANEILSNPEKRKIYDAQGMEGIKNPTPQQVYRGSDLFHELPLTLKEFYNGCTKEVKFDRNVLCTGCKGRGSENPDALQTETCQTCTGKGYKVESISLGIGFAMNQQVRCQKCRGTGKTYSSVDTCKICWGELIVKTPTVLTFKVEPGRNIDDRIGMKRYAHEMLDPNGELAEVGVFFVILKSAPEEDKNAPAATNLTASVWQRSGHDLIYKKELSLKTALCGANFDIEHLDGRILKIAISDVIDPSFCKTIQNEGMLGPNGRGNLIIKFSIKFPKSLSDKEKDCIDFWLPEN